MSIDWSGLDLDDKGLAAKLGGMCARDAGEVTRLVLSGNKLATLPVTLKRLKSLTSLDLSRNQLTAVPGKVLRELEFLRELSLEDNVALGDRAVFARGRTAVLALLGDTPAPAPAPARIAKVTMAPFAPPSAFAPSPPPASEEAMTASAPPPLSPGKLSAARKEVLAAAPGAKVTMAPFAPPPPPPPHTTQEEAMTASAPAPLSPGKLSAARKEVLAAAPGAKVTIAPFAPPPPPPPHPLSSEAEEERNEEEAASSSAPFSAVQTSPRKLDASRLDVLKTGKAPVIRQVYYPPPPKRDVVQIKDTEPVPPMVLCWRCKTWWDHGGGQTHENCETDVEPVTGLGCPCLRCGQWMPHYTAMQRHVYFRLCIGMSMYRQHTGDTSLYVQCRFCLVSVLPEKAHDEHSLACKVVRCPYCAKVFANFDDRGRHLRECKGPVCTSCGEALGNVKQHQDHVPKCGGPRCEYCHSCFKSFAERDKHKESACSKRPEMVACTRCVNGKEKCRMCPPGYRHCVRCEDTGLDKCYACEGTRKVYAKTRDNGRFWALPPSYYPKLTDYNE